MPRPEGGELSQQLLATRAIGDQPARVAQERDAVRGGHAGRGDVRRPKPPGRRVHSHGVERWLTLVHPGAASACTPWQSGPAEEGDREEDDGGPAQAEEWRGRSRALFWARGAARISGAGGGRGRTICLQQKVYQKVSSRSTHLLAEPEAEKDPLRDVDGSRTDRPPPRYTRPLGNQEAAGARPSPSRAAGARPGPSCSSDGCSSSEEPGSF